MGERFVRSRDTRAFQPRTCYLRDPEFPELDHEHLGRPERSLEPRQKARAAHVGMLPARGTGTMLGEFGPKNQHKSVKFYDDGELSFPTSIGSPSETRAIAAASGRVAGRGRNAQA
jgi:hypothetical protein